jgi:hypothetical protein
LPPRQYFCGGVSGGTSCSINADCTGNTDGEECLRASCDYYYFLRNTLDAGIGECQATVDPGIGCVGFYETNRGSDSKYIRADCQPGCQLITQCYDTVSNTFINSCSSDSDCSGANEVCGGVPVTEYPNCVPDPDTSDPNSRPGCLY